MTQRFLLIFHTVKYLKPVQIFYQLYKRTKRKRIFDKYLPNQPISWNKLEFDTNINSKIIIKDNNYFRILNLQKQFNKKVDWDFMGYGKLWYYNLQYFDFLFQENLSNEFKILLIHDFNNWLYNDKIILESYPIALRVINGIRFYSVREGDDHTYKVYYAQLNFLYDNLEYQILGNHLLEDAFALFMGGYVFDNKKWQTKGKKLLYKEIKEQILQDGAHFELSPMYHKIILFRLFELIDWYSKIKDKDLDFLNFVKRKAISMQNWLFTISLWEYSIPHFNDSADGIAYSNEEIFNFAKIVGLPDPEKITLGESGYRKYDISNYQCIIDVGQIGASYQPGHAHADALSFILYYNRQPILVEAGTSTYQIGEIRNYERSTKAHNTVVINNKDQSEVWAGFRVGNRAKVTIIENKYGLIKASHDGYKNNYGIIHERDMYFDQDIIKCVDTIKQKDTDYLAEAYFHIHPDRKIKKGKDYIFIDKNIKLNFEGFTDISLVNYNFAVGYNLYKEAKAVKIAFRGNLNTTITLN